MLAVPQLPWAWQVAGLVATALAMAPMLAGLGWRFGAYLGRLASGEVKA